MPIPSKQTKAKRAKRPKKGKGIQPSDRDPGGYRRSRCDEEVRLCANDLCVFPVVADDYLVGQVLICFPGILASKIMLMESVHNFISSWMDGVAK
jgi:hypothetical protein